MKHMSGSRKTDERVRADPDPEFTCICNKSYHQRDRIHFPAISHTINVGRLYLTLCIQYTVCVPTSHGDSSW